MTLEIRERPLRTASLHLVALPSALTCVRLFITYRLDRWGIDAAEPELQRAAAEQVARAIATCPADRPAPITARLLRYPTHITFELDDR